MTPESRQWIWSCTKRLAELHPGEPMELDDWENVAIELHRSASPDDTPEQVAETFTRMRARRSLNDD